ncbi:MAG: DegT/DnrJ/EryC1/StrS family aminotransferase, partial [Planctomycetota bacterium]
TPFSFVATAGAIAATGALPLFADIDGESFNIDPGGIEELIGRECALERGEGGTTRLRHKPSGRRVAGLLPVHLFGRLAAMEPLRAIAEEFDLALVEDAAQAFGGSAPDGPERRRAGAWGVAGCHSFFPTKNLGGVGDGGLVTTSDRTLAARVARLRVHGAGRRNHHVELGRNSRLDTLQAAVLLRKLPLLDSFLALRRQNAGRYRELLEQGVRSGRLALPVDPPDGSHTYNQFVVRVEERDDVSERLGADGIGHSIYYPIPLSLQPCFSDLGYQKGDFPVAERACEECLALPIHPGLTEEEQERVAGSLLAAMRVGTA